MRIRWENPYFSEITFLVKYAVVTEAFYIVSQGFPAWISLMHLVKEVHYV